MIIVEAVKHQSLEVKTGALGGEECLKSKHIFSSGKPRHSTTTSRPAEAPRQQESRKSQRPAVLVELFQIDNGSEEGLVCQKWHTAGTR